MTTPETYHIAFGMMKVTTQPLIVRTIVGTGYAVALCAGEGVGGGLFHLPMKQATCKFDEKWISDKMNGFIAELTRSKIQLSQAVARIIGGADTMAAFPQPLWLKKVNKDVEVITTILRQRGIYVEHVIVGGTESRSVGVDTINCSITAKSSGIPARAKTGRPQPVAALPTIKSDTNISPITVDIGCSHVDRSPVKMTAILGSCVGIALYDKSTGIGGLVHAMMPTFPGNGDRKSKYVDSAVPELIDQMLGAGAARGSIKAKLAGGAKTILIDEPDSVFKISERNIASARESLERERIEIVGEDVGGNVGRKVYFDLVDFKMRVKMISPGRAVKC